MYTYDIYSPFSSYIRLPIHHFGAKNAPRAKACKPIYSAPHSSIDLLSFRYIQKRPATGRSFSYFTLFDWSLSGIVPVHV